tara:strand:- start:55 stop:567 length:513 start_codon:yes stop_codon:yes gene_type:complete
MNKKIPTVINLENTKDNQDQLKLLDLLAPLVETMTSRSLITALNSRDKLDLRLNSFVWGYLNSLTFGNAEKCSISIRNKKVLGAVSASLHSILFNNSVASSELEYLSVFQSIKNIKTLKDEFFEGTKACDADIPKIGIDVPIRNSLLPSLNIFLLKKIEEFEPYKKTRDK